MAGFAADGSATGAHAAGAQSSPACSLALRPRRVRSPGERNLRAGMFAVLTTNGDEIEGPIASGAFSTIIKARHNESGTEIAVKAFKSTPLAKT